ncbi:transcriptional regulator, ModE family [Sulfuricurvum kujiense DSM 16994]|uniref:Transcriptional regulator, ModE family n=1 Tax=Sulfuricurvum kujiense (strain ATCC BAA-921 / DSM 16994 / JCM 11577 / YK-1) TaxID=709032 RepID=E4TWY0_SULKY|nr:TOBE domain-containing protein [Sulfuricurvum kujiense]ADR33821.1 transcriptional regulator, ModE family [Sulfuricurvum kujiense DSM 16994]
MKIDGRFWLTKEGQSFLGAGRIELLERIDKTGSINAAAKEMKMSYKAAWERINGMNALADQPLIERLTGGKGGGGTKLTPYARELIATFHRFNELHRQFIDRFSEAGDDPERLARILSRTFLTTSARNQLPATLLSIEERGLNGILTLSLAGNHTLRSVITLKSIKNMGLSVGCDLYAIIKSSDVTIVTDPAETDETLNCLQGTIVRIESQDETDEIIFQLNHSTELVALMNPKDTQKLSEGMNAYALIAPSHIIIGL